jgi:hypothetical protein
MSPSRERNLGTPPFNTYLEENKNWGKEGNIPNNTNNI